MTKGYHCSHNDNPVTSLFAFGCSIDSPSISHRYCWCVIVLTSSLFFGHRNLPSSNLLYKRRNPSPSQYKPLILSFFLPQNRNNVLVNGLRSNCACTIVASPSIPFLISVYPQAIYTLSAPVKSLNIGQSFYYRCYCFTVYSR